MSAIESHRGLEWGLKHQINTVYAVEGQLSTSGVHSKYDPVELILPESENENGKE
jgi:hypothetical protein